MKTPLFTPFPEVNTVLEALLRGQRAALGDALVGVYLYGSLALGDFDPAHSDIDFAAVTSAELADSQLGALRAMHSRLFASGLPLADQLEGSYLSRAALRKHGAQRALHAHIDRGEGELQMAQHESDWVVQRYSLRAYGVVLFGPPPATLIDPISPQALRLAVLDILHSWWVPMLHDTDRLRQPGYQAYAVATFCRMLYTLEHGGLASKPKAARWALPTLNPRCAALVDRALAYQLGPDDIPTTLDLLRLALERSWRHEQAPPGGSAPADWA